MQDNAFYKSFSSKYTDEDVERLSGTISFVSHTRLLTQSISDCIGLRPTEVIVGIAVDGVGIKVYIEHKN